MAMGMNCQNKPDKPCAMLERYVFTLFILERSSISSAEMPSAFEMITEFFKIAAVNGNRFKNYICFFEKYINCKNP